MMTSRRDESWRHDGMMIRILGIIPIAGYENSYFQAVELL